MGLRSKPGLGRGGRFGSGLKPGSLPNSELVRAIVLRSEGKRGREVAGPSCIIGFYSTIKFGQAEIATQGLIGLISTLNNQFDAFVLSSF